MEDNITEADMKIVSAFGDVIHQNNSDYLNISILDDQTWKIRWTSLTDLPIQSYNLLIEVVGWWFLDGLNAIITGIVDLWWNYERLVVYPIVILQYKKGL